jgi:hypothetical protein
MDTLEGYAEATATYLSPQKSGLVFGALLGGWHLIWAIIVAAGWSQSLIDFIFWMHFLNPVLVVEPFSIGRAIVLVLVTAAIGYFIGFAGSVLWNRFHVR